MQAEREGLVVRGQRSGSRWCCVILCPTLTTRPLLRWCPSNPPSCSMETRTASRTCAVCISCSLLQDFTQLTSRLQRSRNSILIVMLLFSFIMCILFTGADGADGALSPQQGCRPPPVAPPQWVGPVVCSQPLRSLSPPDGLENPAEERPNVSTR